jgi:hypothetical protein
MPDGDAWDEFDGDGLLMRDEIEKLRLLLAAGVKLHTPKMYDRHQHQTKDPEQAVSAWCPSCSRRVPVTGCPTLDALTGRPSG